MSRHGEAPGLAGEAGADGTGPRVRLDRALVARGLAPSRAAAQADVRAGRVTVNGATARRAAMAVAPADALAVAVDGPRRVGRGALKLVAALDAFALDPAGLACLDLGASTGGFTEVLLERGARRVVALDVGRDQLHPRLAADPRVVRLEGLNARDLAARHLPEPPAVVTADLSFISLTLALPPALALAAPGAIGVFLVKPQFEVGRAAVGRGGIVKDPAARAAAVETVARFVAATPGWSVLGTTPSPIAGGDGNRETLIAARKAAL